MNTLSSNLRFGALNGEKNDTQPSLIPNPHVQCTCIYIVHVLYMHTDKVHMNKYSRRQKMFPFTVPQNGVIIMDCSTVKNGCNNYIENGCHIETDL